MNCRSLGRPLRRQGTLELSSRRIDRRAPCLGQPPRGREAAFFPTHPLIYNRHTMVKPGGYAAEVRAARSVVLGGSTFMDVRLGRVGAG